MAEEAFKGHDVRVSFISSSVATTPSSLHDDQRLITASPPRKPLPQLWYRRVPYFIITASFLEIIVYMIVKYNSSPNDFLVFNPHRRYEVWRFLSYVLLHQNQVHLVTNVAVQCSVAAPLEWEQGAVRTALVYLGGALAGALGTSVLQPTLYIVGASAGIYALLISHLSNILLNFSSLKYKLWRVVSVMLLALSDVAYSIVHYYDKGNRGPMIGWAAHCSGAVAGFLLGLIVFRNLNDQKQEPRVKAAIIVAAYLLATAAFTSVAINIINNDALSAVRFKYRW